MATCPCGSNLNYDECCLPLIKGDRTALTAEQLMRSRYTAYAMKEIGYLKSSLHPDYRSDFDEKTSRAWAENSEWLNLEIVGTVGGGTEESEGKVEFIATFIEKGIKREHHELSTFRKEAGTWYLVNGEVQLPKPVVRATPKTGRNDPCPCGSGKKFKKCCAVKETA